MNELKGVDVLTHTHIDVLTITYNERKKCKKCPNTDFFHVCIFPYSIQIRKNDVHIFFILNILLLYERG